ncbi:MAG: substrate-binding domain-containing protein [Lentisphaeria bacterium]|nr:substrate-binding domain-containing protein [Lentisphaeria bacterium]
MARHYNGTKASCARHELLRQIQLGNFPRGSRLPSEQLLAEQLDVSHMTVRKVIAELIRAEYLCKKPRIGTFISDRIPEDKLQRQLGVIGPAWSHPLYNDSMTHLSALFEQENWICRYAFARHWEDRTIDEIYESSDALVLYPVRSAESVPPALREKLESQAKPVVYAGNPGVFRNDTVSFNDEEGFAILLRQLGELGHSRIGFITQRIPDQHSRPHNETLFLHAASKRPGCRVSDIAVECPSFQSPADAVYRRIREFGAEACSVLVGGSSMILAAWAALTDTGIRVPEEVSLVILGESAMLNYLRPRPAQCSFSLVTQTRLIRELILHRLENPASPVQVLKVPPRFFPGETLKRIL